MEEERIGALYAGLWRQRVAALWSRVFPRGLRRSPFFPAGIIALLIVVPFIGYRMHEAGRFSTLKREMKGEKPGAHDPRPGGLDPIVLSRTPVLGSRLPEFGSITLLPGLGMSVQQITAQMPGGDKLSLLVGPTLDQIVGGSDLSPSGPNDSRGAFEVPWGGIFAGRPSPSGGSVAVNWNGKPLEALVNAEIPLTSQGGALMLQAANEVHTEGASGTAAQATFRSIEDDGKWASKSDVSIAAEMKAATIDFTVRVTNSGDSPEPVGVGWHPRFALSSPRNTVELHLPAGESVETTDRKRRLPSGRLIPYGPAIQRFVQSQAAIRGEDIDEALAARQPVGSHAGQSAEVAFPSRDFGLRMTSLTAGVNEFRVFSPANSDYISLGAQTNFDDPFGAEWVKKDEKDGPRGGMVTLLPGASLEWKVRLEIFPLGH